MMTVLYVMLGIVGSVVVVGWVLFQMYTGTINRLVALDQRCDTAYSDIDVQLKHRHNLIPGLVEVVKGAKSHERDLVLGVVEARAKALSAVSSEVRLNAEGNLSAQIGSLIATADSLPELRALPEFAQLRQQLVECENRITATRRFYNLAIEEYNIALRQYPGSLVAPRRHMTTRQPFDLGFERVLIDEPAAIAF